MAKDFQDFVDQKPDWVSAVTINHALVSDGADLTATSRVWRSHLHEVLSKNLPHTVVRGIFEVAPTWADTTAIDFPDDAVDPVFQVPERPAAPAGLFHLHGLILHPFQTREQVGKALRAHYRGSNRVRIEPVRSEWVDGSNRVRGGLVGWAEYAAMEKFHINPRNNRCFNDQPDNVDLFCSFYRMTHPWHRNARKFKYSPLRGNEHRAWLGKLLRISARSVSFIGSVVEILSQNQDMVRNSCHMKLGNDRFDRDVMDNDTLDPKHVITSTHHVHRSVASGIPTDSELGRVDEVDSQIG
tara:strand:+ start:176 stop:1069 length:894 start_codon:yes stop_codon:yes gene_type:complete